MAEKTYLIQYTKRIRTGWIEYADRQEFLRVKADEIDLYKEIIQEDHTITFAFYNDYSGKIIYLKKGI